VRDWKEDVLGKDASLLLRRRKKLWRNIEMGFLENGGDISIGIEILPPPTIRISVRVFFGERSGNAWISEEIIHTSSQPDKSSTPYRHSSLLQFSCRDQ